MDIPLTADATLRPLVLPARADAGDAGELHEFAEVRNQVYREVTGRDDQDLTPEALLPVLRSSADRTTHVWAVRRAGRIIGRAMVDVPMDEGARAVMATIELLPSAWGQGIGRAILPHIEAAARRHGRTVIHNWTEQQAVDGPRLQPPTGFGSVPDDHAARFLRRSGFTLEQVYRISVLELDQACARLARALESEAADVARDYRVVSWLLPTPDAHVDGYAWMKSRMSTDAPSADLAADEEQWDADRLRRMEERERERGHTMLVTAAQHRATGVLTAFTELGIGRDGRATTHQNDTLVLREHRGHRLGMLVKAAGLRAWTDVAPDSPRVITYNAEENRPMLAINEALGFTARAYEGVWKKELT